MSDTVIPVVKEHYGRLKNYINGEWVDADTDKYWTEVNPASQAPIAEVPLGGKSDMDRAIEAAQAAFQEWRETPPQSRAQYLYKLKTLEIDATAKAEAFENEKNQLLADRDKLHGIFKNEVRADLQVIRDLPAFEKIKEKLKLPPEKEDKSFDFDAWESEDALLTKSKLSEYKELGLFGDVFSPTKVQTPIIPKSGEPIDLVELARTDPKAAREELDRRRTSTRLF